jgi:Domain of unknown function (DUF222)/HNH endonuclease
VVGFLSYPGVIIEHMFDTEGIEALESTIGELAAGDLKRWPDEELERGIVALQRAIDRLGLERLRLIAEVNRRKAFARDGYVSASAWLADRNRTTFGSAKRDVAMAAALEEMPRTRKALERGEVSATAAAMLVKAREAAEAAFETQEAALVADAGKLPVGALRARLSEWVQKVDPDDVEARAEVRYIRRRLDVFPAADGMVRVNGDLDPESGSPVIAALGAIVNRELTNGPDRRTPGQRRADALAEICSTWRGTNRGDGVGDRPDVTVIVDLKALAGSAAGRSELPEVGPITPETARRIACDASVSRVITRGPSEPLEVGRRTQVVPASLRRAIAVRDGGCRFPGCDRPGGWCDAHHVVHWADGGQTNLSNLVLLCRAHHRMAHQGFSIRMTASGPTFRRPDGSVIQGSTHLARKTVNSDRAG